MIKKLLSYSVAISIILVIACTNETKDEPSPPISASDIKISSILTSNSGCWLTNGDVFTINIDGSLNYSSLNGDVSLSSIQMEKDGKVIGTTKYAPDCSVSAKVDNWTHGENEIKLYAVFTSSGKEIVKEICKTTIIIFNVLPKYDIEGTAFTEIKWQASNGEKYYRFIEIESDNHIFKYSFEISWLASNGELFHSNSLQNLQTSFHIDKSQTNFEVDITSEELHWHTPDGPSELPEGEELGDKEILYVDFTIKGEHEGIKISQDVQTNFWFIRGN